MLLFANGDGFWVIKTVSDLISIIGFVLALFSIWLAWWLAKRDIEKRIAKAQLETFARLTAIVLQGDVSETSRLLRESAELCRAKHWARAIDRLEQAMQRVPRFRQLPGLESAVLPRLDQLVDQLRLLIRQIEEVIDGKRTGLTTNKTRELQNLTVLLATIEGKIRAEGLR